jgi:hypothetical protein
VTQAAKSVVQWQAQRQWEESLGSPGGDELSNDSSGYLAAERFDAPKPLFAGVPPRDAPASPGEDWAL